MTMQSHNTDKKCPFCRGAMALITETGWIDGDTVTATLSCPDCCCLTDRCDDDRVLRCEHAETAEEAIAALLEASAYDDAPDVEQPHFAAIARHMRTGAQWEQFLRKYDIETMRDDGPRRYIVRSNSRTYTVVYAWDNEDNEQRWACNCPASEYSPPPACRHIIAVQQMRWAELEAAGIIPSRPSLGAGVIDYCTTERETDDDTNS